MKYDTPALYIIGTPIGNTADISPRACEVIENMDLIACEDTRSTRKLLQLLGLKAPMLTSYYDQIEESKSKELVQDALDKGLKLGLMSDAGMPAISDPGFRLVKEAHENSLKVVTIPGPTALSTLAAASGLPTNRLLFVGFLPTKATALSEEISSWSSCSATVLFYESPKRIKKVVKVIEAFYPKALIALGRELTKLYEEVLYMPVGEASDFLEAQKNFKGELACALYPNIGNHKPHMSREQAFEASIKLLNEGMSTKEIKLKLKDKYGSKKDLYDLIIEAKDILKL